MAVEIRTATAGDVSFLAWVLQAAARSQLERGAWDLAFPGPEAERLSTLEALAGTEAVHYAHLSRFLVASRDGEPVAALSAYDRGQHGDEKLQAGLVEALAARGRAPRELREIGERLEPVSTTGYVVHDDHWVIEWVATRPDARRQGLVDALLETILDRGRAAGYRRAQIGIMIGNEPARKAYEKHAFVVEAEYRSDPFLRALGSPGMASLSRAL